MKSRAVSRRFLLGVAVACLGAIVVLLLVLVNPSLVWFSSEPAANVVGIESEEFGSAVPNYLSPDPQHSSGDAARPDSEYTRRQTIDNYSGRVLKVDGDPIPGATISWSWPAVEWQRMPALERAWLSPALLELSALADADGRFAFKEADVHERGGVIWVTAPGFQSDYREVDSETGLNALEPFVLETKSGLEVEVVDAQGDPVASALVVTVHADYPTHLDGLRMSRLARTSLLRTARTDAEGRCSLPALLGEQHLLTRVGDQRAPIWGGLAPASVRMVLAPTLMVTGHVRVSPGLDVDEMRVTMICESEGARRNLARAGVQGNGTFGPSELPVVDSDRLVFRLEGGGVIPIEKVVEPVPPGTHLSITFEPTAGASWLLEVQDDAGEDIAGATIIASWRSGDAWLWAEGRSDIDGQVLIDAIQPGDVWIRARAKNHLLYSSEKLSITDPIAQPLLIRLKRAGLVHGRVLHEGEPVPTFRLVYFDSVAKEPSFASVSDNPYGTFELTDAPLGLTSIIATAPELAPSDAIVIEVESGSPASIEFHLLKGGSGQGRVFNALTGQPVSDASIETMISQDGWDIAPTGAMAHTDEDGRFVLKPMRAKEDLQVRAPGYSYLKLSVYSGSQDPVEISPIALAPVQELRVIVEGSGVEIQKCRIRLQEPQESGWQQFSDKGEVIFEEVACGPGSLLIELEGGTQIQERFFLASGEAWTVPVRIEASPIKGLEVVVKSDSALPDDLFVRALTYTGVDRSSARLVQVNNGRCWIPGPLGPESALDLRDRYGRVFSLRYLRAADFSAGRVEIEFKSSRSRFRIVDKDDRPLSRVRTMVGVVGSTTPWCLWGDTDLEGRIQFPSIQGESLVVHLRTPDGGGGADFKVSSKELEGGEVELILDASSRLDVELVDGPVVLPGLISSLLTTSGIRMSNIAATDAHGRTGVQALMPGSYVLEITPPGYWGRYVPVEVSREPKRVTVQLRRLGALKIEVRSFDGEVAGASVQLENIELGETVAQWISAGRVVGTTESLKVDSSGVVQVFGIPHGSYRYRILSLNGLVAHGEVTVQPHSQVAAIVHLH